MISETLSHYKILSRLGAGGMGEVYLAEDTRLGRKVALKLLSPNYTGDSRVLLRFQQEARAVSLLNHPNIITIYDIGLFGDSFFIATEFIEGETLRSYMAGRRMKMLKVVDVAIQVASALAAAHTAGIVHRDVKPENIMLRPDGYVKVLDFGIAKLAEPLDSPVIEVNGGSWIEGNKLQGEEAAQTEQVEEPRPDTLEIRSDTLATPTEPIDSPFSLDLNTDSTFVIGTPSYMSPEQAEGLRVDARNDIFSLGVVIYEMVTGRAPFSGATVSEVILALLTKQPAPLTDFDPSAPPELCRIVDRALRKNRDERYQEITEMLVDLKLLEHELITGTPVARYGEIPESSSQEPQLKPAETNPAAPSWKRSIKKILRGKKL